MVAQMDLVLFPVSGFIPVKKAGFQQIRQQRAGV